MMIVFLRNLMLKLMKKNLRLLGSAYSLPPGSIYSKCLRFILVSIARWMAKAYGYAARKKEAYKSNKVGSVYLCHGYSVVGQG